MQNLLNCHKLKLLYTRNKSISMDSSNSGWNMAKWNIAGDWHVMTVATNEDKSSGLDGGIALHTAGSYNGGTMERVIELKNYGEILFEHYIQNGKNGETGQENSLIFYNDNIKKLEIQGPSPWQRCIPIGLTPGKHTIKFEYIYKGAPNEKKAVVDTVTVWEGKLVNCIITEHTPPMPSKNIGSNKVLRGFTRYQEMTAADTEIKFTAVFNGSDFSEFMLKSDEPFYFVDEFGTCYRGIFPETVEPKSIVMNEIYSVELSMIAGQKTGLGFC